MEKRSRSALHRSSRMDVGYNRAHDSIEPLASTAISSINITPQRRPFPLSTHVEIRTVGCMIDGRFVLRTAYVKAHCATPLLNLKNRHHLIRSSFTSFLPLPIVLSVLDRLRPTRRSPTFGPRISAVRGSAPCFVRQLNVIRTRMFLRSDKIGWGYPLAPAKVVTLAKCTI